MERTTTNMPRTRNKESGKYTETYPQEAFIQAIEDAGGSATSTEVADAVGCVYDTAYKKLRAIEKDGYIESRKVGNARLWTVTDQ